MSSAAQRMDSGTLPKTGNAFLDSHAPDAIASQRETGVPASVTLAQAAIESGWGKSGLAVKYKNYFGIKGKGPGGTAVMSTGEHFNGQDVVIKDGFRVYRTVAESFADHGRFFIVNKRYAEAMRHKDNAEQFAVEIHKAGYATDPKYSDKLIKFIRQYKLEKLDQFARGETPTGGTVIPLVSSGTTKPSKQAVKELQQILVKYGYMTEEQMKTGPGILGPKTRAAVSKLLDQQGQSTPSGKPGNVVTGGGKGTGTIPVSIDPSPKPGSGATGTPNYAQISKDFNAKIPGSKYFTWHEALWLPQFKRHANEGEVSPTILGNIVRQAKALDGVRDHFKNSIVVHCWLRPPAYNKKIGGAKNSAHLRGTATDFHIEGFTAEQVRKVLIAKKSIYPGCGELGVSWLHLDLEHKAWFRP
jgi:hypothetical protein